jgi:hypothetical protein
MPRLRGLRVEAGGDRNLNWMIEVAEEGFAELKVKDAKTAVISGEIRVMFA